VKPLFCARSWIQPCKMLYSATSSPMSYPSRKRSNPWTGGLPWASASGILWLEP